MESRLAFRLMYLVGFTPWDNPTPPPELIAFLEEGDVPPARALDVGCGSGRNSMVLAKRGWDVTGIDFVPRALKKAKRRFAAAGVQARFVEGDVTRLKEAGISGPFRLFLDVGCFHSIAPPRRAAYADGLAAVAEPGATYLLFAFTVASGPRPAVPPEEVRATFQRDWEPVSEKIDPPPGDGAWYRYTRKTS